MEKKTTHIDVRQIAKIRSLPRTPWFIVTSGELSTGKLFQLREGMVIGRALGVDQQLKEGSVSRRHLRVDAISGDRIRVSDCGTANAIVFRGQQVTQAELKSGDDVNVGSVTLTLVMLEDRGGAIRENRSETVTSVSALLDRKALLSGLSMKSSLSGRGESGACILLTIDQSLAIEYALGQEALQKLYEHLATLLNSIVQTGPLSIGQLAPDQLGILYPCQGQNDADMLAQWAIRMSTQIPPALTGNKPVTISVGLMFCPAPFDAASVMAEAQRRLYRAIAEGGNRAIGSP